MAYVHLLLSEDVLLVILSVLFLVHPHVEQQQHGVVMVRLVEPQQVVPR
jgi:hypothetical protein